MKTKPILKSLAGLALGAALFGQLQSPPAASARILDGGVNTDNLRMGDHLYILGNATNKLNGKVLGVTDIPSLLSYMKNQGMKYVIVKAGTGSTNYNGTGSTPQFSTNLIHQAHLLDMKVFAYTRSYGDNVPGEIALATNYLALGADGFVIDAESEWESGHLGSTGPAKAIQLCEGIRAAYPSRFLGHAPFPYITSHPSFPYKEFGYYCDIVMPQDYWNYIEVTPQQMVNDMETQYRNFYNGLTGKWTNSAKPLAPLGQADNTNIPPSEVQAFAAAVLASTNPITPGGYTAINWWETYQRPTNLWAVMPAISQTIGTQVGPGDIIVDNTAAVYVGTWTTASSANDKYGADYRFKSQGTGTAHATFTPTIPVAGQYKVFSWHSSGSNRSSNAPVTITHAGGTNVVGVNQKTLGGSWRYLGTYSFNVGTGGSVRISDNFPDAGQIMMTDAVMFSYVIPTPTAPSGLAATTVDGPLNTLTWTDNSSDEVNFIIYRGLSAGGPYTPIAWLAANTVSYNDTTAAGNATYYYRVRAANEGGYSADSNEASVTTSGTVVDIIIDNLSASITGTWSSATASTDKFATDYIFRSQGTGANTALFTPSIQTPGNYQVSEWHTQGGNRSTATPHIITHSGGTTTNAVNQTSNGGKWNVLGTFAFTTGTAGSVKITDNIPTSGTLAVADAIKFAFVPLVTTPAAPSGLTATAVSATQINLSWTDNANNEDSFTVARSITAGGPYSDIAVLPANTTAYSSTALTPASTYYFVVRAANTGGASTNSAQASATTLPNPPAAPSALAGTATGQTTLNLTWTDNANNETGFAIGRSTTSGSGYVDIAVLGADVTAYSDSGLTANTTYYYVVRAYNTGGASANSAEVSVTTLPNPPADPSGLAVTTASQTQIDLSWADNADNETGFVLGRATSSGGPYTDIVTLGADVTSYSDTALAAATTYYYVVRAVNTGGDSANSSEASATTLPNPPTAPSGLAASTVDQTQVNLSWADNADNETSQIVGRSTTAGGPYTDIATLGADVTGYSDSGLAANTTYYYVVRASNSGGDSASSGEASATTLPNPPAAPSGLAASAVSQTQINLSWTDNANNETTFTVARSTTSGSGYADIATLGADVTSYNDTGLAANTTYYYVVRASNSGGTSANTAEASATTLPNPPAAPSGLAAVTASQTQINLSWTDNANNETAIIVARSTTAGGPYTDIATLGANATSYNNTGLTAGTTYYYVVRASNAGGNSANSAEASATTLPTVPSAPSALIATAVRASQISLSWTDNSSNEASFIVARSTTSGSGYVDIATLGANTTTYSSTGLAANTTYYFVVRASNAGGTSANTAEASITTFETDLLIDNRSALVAGSWSSGTSSTDKYGTTYHFKSAGTGSAYLQYTPYVATNGLYEVYEWHPQGSNRETNAQHIVLHASGSATNYVNQRTNGGKWNLLGSWNFTTGSSGYVRITDQFTSTNTLMADAVKFVFIMPPAAPSALTATTISAAQINLAWTDNSTNESGFIVGRSTTAGGPYTDIVTVGANVTTYNNTGLTANTTYYYVVRATGTGGSSATTAEATATTLPTIPTAPSGPTATVVSQTQINLSWTDNSSNEANFIVGRSTTAGGPYTDIVTLGANVTSYNNTGLTANTTYYYVIRASNAGGSSANTAQVSGTTLPTIPTAPSALTATAVSSTQINLSWTDNSSNEANFIVGRSTVNGGPYTDIVTLGANVTSYNNTGLTQGTTYYFVVRAANTGGSSANTAQASATTLTLPNAPSGLAVTVISSGQLNLTWTDNSANETGFILARSTTSGSGYVDVATVAANVVSYSNTGLAANTTYYYVVRATNAAGASANSAQASGTTLPAPPSPPGGLAATAVSSSQINLTWTDNSPNETSFVVARSTTSGSGYVDIATLGANVTSYSSTGLNASTTYYYVVRAVNAGGASPNSNQASATTQTGIPTAPSALVATALSSTSIRLTWTDNSANENNFVVRRSTVNGGPYTTIATVAANTTSYTNTALNGSTTYYYVVQATNASGASANSAQASATTQPVAEIIVDNGAATVTGSWSSGTSSTDKYGADYRFKSPGTGTAYLTYRPNVVVAGNYQVYEWHPVGSNRPTNAPVILSYNGGTRTNFVNQTINGGAWVALGTPVNFTTGTNGFIRISDNFTEAGKSLMADAVKIVYVP